VGQAAHVIPKYRSGLARAVRRSRERNAKEANLAESDGEPTTAAKCTLRIGQKAQTAIVDSGAATSIITKSLLDKLGLVINRSSKMIVVTANGARTRSLGIIDNVPVNIGKIQILTSFQVLESKDEILILGNDWLRETNANMNWEQSTLTIKQGKYVIRIPITFTKTAKVVTQEEEESDDDDEFEDEYLEEYPVYFSDECYESDSNDNSELEFNPWNNYYSQLIQKKITMKKT